MDIRSLTPIGRWLYAGTCVLLPMAWGLAIVWAANQVERLVARRRNRHPGPAGTQPEPPTLEYHI